MTRLTKLVLMVLVLSACPAAAQYVSPYQDLNMYDRWQQEDQMRRMEDQQQEMNRRLQQQEWDMQRLESQRRMDEINNQIDILNSRRYP